MWFSKKIIDTKCEEMAKPEKKKIVIHTARYLEIQDELNAIVARMISLRGEWKYIDDIYMEKLLKWREESKKDKEAIEEDSPRILV